MIMNKECYMIQDLLPSYIDQLTSEETNKYIESHMKNCEECKDIFNNMKNNNKDNKETILEKEEKVKYINFAKKYNIKFNILKLIIIIITIVFVIVFFRRAFIMKSLNANAKNYENISNYHSICYQYDLKDIKIFESYNKDGNYLRTCKTVERMSGNIVNTLTEYKKDDVINLYIDTPEEKRVIKNVEVNTIMPIEAKSYYLDFDNILYFMKSCIFSNVKKVECNGIECYRFVNLYNSQVANFKNDNFVYIDIKTGLPVRATDGIVSSDFGTYNNITEFYYEFNSVTDKDLVEPNIENYIIQN